MADFKTVFPRKKTLIGMIHLGGTNTQDRVRRAMEEVAIYREEGMDGAIVENHFTPDRGVVERVIDELVVNSPGIRIGVNILPNEYETAFRLAERVGPNSFIQLDYVAGRYEGHSEGEIFLDGGKFSRARERFKAVLVLGGVHPKYYEPVVGSNLNHDLIDGMTRADGIVVTGEGTGKETPLSKIGKYKGILQSHPLIVGAGVTPVNARAQLEYADGAIVGTSIKEMGQTQKPVDRLRVRDLVSVVRDSFG